MDANRAVGTVAGALIGASSGFMYGLLNDAPGGNFFGVPPEQEPAFQRMVFIDGAGGAAIGAAVGNLLGAKVLIGAWLAAGAVMLLTRKPPPQRPTAPRV